MFWLLPHCNQHGTSHYFLLKLLNRILFYYCPRKKITWFNALICKHSFYATHLINYCHENNAYQWIALHFICWDVSHEWFYFKYCDVVIISCLVITEASLSDHAVQSTQCVIFSSISFAQPSLINAFNSNAAHPINYSLTHTKTYVINCSLTKMSCLFHCKQTETYLI